MRRHFGYLTWAIVLSCAVTVGQQRPTPPAGPAPIPRIARAQAPIPAPYAGTVDGFVYWDANNMFHKPAASCSGLSITVKAGTPLNGSAPQMESFHRLSAANAGFKYIGTVSARGLGGRTYAVCSYAYDHVPVGQDLQIELTVPDPLASFGTNVAPQVAILGPIKLINVHCNMLPRLADPSVGDLMAHWSSCQNMAYDVNFFLVHPQMLQTQSSGNWGGVQSGLGSSMLLKQTVAPGMLTNPMPASTGQSPSRRVLLPASPSPVASNPQPGAAGGLVEDTPRSAFPGAAASSAGAITRADGGYMGNFVPKMPPISSNPKRDASSLADAVARAKIKDALARQVAAARLNTTQNSLNLKPAPSNAPEIQTLQRQALFVGSLRTQPGPSTGALISKQVPNLAIQAPPNRMVHAPAPTKICFAPQIHSVNGKSSGLVFTQDPAYNDYIITGCDFGSQPGQVYLSGAVTGGRINMVVKQWSDTQIEALVEPGLRGVLDGWPDLIVTPASGSPAKLANCRFYSQRESVLLPFMPESYVTLANVAVGDATHGFGAKYCPGPDLNHLFPCIAFNAGPPLAGITNGHDYRNSPNELVSNAVDRDGGQMDFKSGEDIYDLSSLTPGFQIDYATVYWYAWTRDVCEGWASDAFPKKPGDSISYETEGSYRWYLKSKTKIAVDWGVDHCAWRWLGMFAVDDWYNSGYSLQLYVKGPIGVDPWPGNALNSGRKANLASSNRIAQLK
jgi:hypothetical protein